MPTQSMQKTKTTVGTAVGIITLTAVALAALGYGAYSAFFTAPVKQQTNPPVAKAPQDALTSSAATSPPILLNNPNLYLSEL